jgi:hypothetical protein
MGDGDAGKISEMRSAQADEFSVKYEPLDRTGIPKDMMAELEEMS